MSRTESSNGKVTREVMIEITLKPANTQAISKQITEGTKAIWTAQQQILSNHFELWQRYPQTYFELVIQFSQHSLDFHQRINSLIGSNFKTVLTEQRLALEAIESFYDRMQLKSGRVFELLKSA